MMLNVTLRVGIGILNVIPLTFVCATSAGVSATFIYCASSGIVFTSIFIARNSRCVVAAFYNGKGRRG